MGCYGLMAGQSWLALAYQTVTKYLLGNEYEVTRCTRTWLSYGGGGGGYEKGFPTVMAPVCNLLLINSNAWNVSCDIPIPQYTYSLKCGLGTWSSMHCMRESLAAFMFACVNVSRHLGPGSLRPAKIRSILSLNFAICPCDEFQTYDELYLRYL